MKTIETEVMKLSGPALDWVLAHAMGFDTSYRREGEFFVVEVGVPQPDDVLVWQDWHPTTNPAQVIQLISDLRVSVEPVGCQWLARAVDHHLPGAMPAAAVDGSLLVAVCRALTIALSESEWPVPEELMREAR